MTKRFTTQKEHDNVLNATSKAYDEYKDKGHIVSINFTDHPQHDIGNGNFPDLVVWRPGGDFGISEIIEEIETTETINEKSIPKWIRYSKFPSTFYLIVPKEYGYSSQGTC